MSKKSLLTAVTLLGTTSILTAQFSPLPDLNTVTSSGDQVDAYVQLIQDQGWGAGLDTSNWTVPGPSTTMDFDPFQRMNVVFLGEGVFAKNDFGLHWGQPSETYGNDNSTFDNSETLFRAVSSPTSIDKGHFVSVDLNGRDSFDFWLSSEIRRSSTNGWIASVFHPEMSSGADSRLQGVGNVQVINGETYYLFAMRNIDKEPDAAGASALLFFTHFYTPHSPEAARDGQMISTPEPAFYGIGGALLLGGLILRRRSARNKAV